MLKAALWMSGAIVSFTTMAIAGRAVSDTLNTFEIMLFRSIIGLTIVLVLATFAGTRHEINKGRIGLHFIRNAAHFTGQNFWFFALPIVPLTQLFALEFTTPIWVILLSPLILKERLTLIGIASALLGFLGILLVARPEAGPIGVGFFAAASCAVFFAITAILTRLLTRTETITCIMFFLTLSQAMFGAIMLLIVPPFADIFGVSVFGLTGGITWPSINTWPWVVLIAISGLLAHYCLTKALSLAPASIVMPIDFVRLPLIAIIGMVFYAEPLSIFVLFGAVLIFAANYLNITRGAR